MLYIMNWYTKYKADVVFDIVGETLDFFRLLAQTMFYGMNLYTEYTTDVVSDIVGRKLEIMSSSTQNNVFANEFKYPIYNGCRLWYRRQKKKKLLSCWRKRCFTFYEFLYQI